MKARKADTTPAEKRRRTIEDRQLAHFDKTSQARKEFFSAVRRAVKTALRKELTARELKLYTHCLHRSGSGEGAHGADREIEELARPRGIARFQSLHPGQMKPSWAADRSFEMEKSNLE